MHMIPLNGVWSFATDPAREGLKEGFPQAEHPFQDAVPVPGSWRLTPRYRDYHGCAWYKRSFTLTGADAARRVQVYLGGVFRYADIYVNGAFVMGHKGFQSGFRADISAFVRPGENCIAVMADDAQDRSFDIMGGASVMETQYVPIAGIYEPVRLEISEAVSISDVYAPLDMQGGLIRMELTVENHTGGPADARIAVRILSERDGTVAAERRAGLRLTDTLSRCGMEFPMSAVRLWSPEEPALYRIEAVIEADGVSDIFTQRTGFKQFETVGSHFHLNGQPYFLRGYGDDFVYPMTGLPDAEDSGFYRHGIRRAKQYGFNAARHHSHFPFQAYLDAADELGLLVQPELAMANIPADWFQDSNRELFLSQWRELLLENRRHPCIMAWCGGNEQEWGYPFERELYDTAKQLDAYRPVMATDGNFMAREVGSAHDYASIVYAEYTDVLPLDEFAGMYLRDNCGKPQIVHEMGNYTTLPAIDDLPQYEGAAVYPEPLARYAQRIVEKGLDGLYRRCLRNSHVMQRLCHKINIEAARQSPFVSGYHIWTFSDYYDTTQGIVSSLYEDKAFTPAGFAELNAASLLLWDTARYVFQARECVCVVLKVSKFDPQDWPGAKVTLRLSDGQCFTVENDVCGCGVLPLAVWPVTLPLCASAQRLELRVTLESGERTWQNAWLLWVYPPCAIRNEKEIFINYLSRYLIEDCPFPVRHFTIPMPLNERNLIITGFVYNGMLEAVENGAAMLLTAGPGTFRSTVRGNSFKSPWWMAQPFFYLNRTNNSQAANIVEEHPALSEIPHGECWELNLYHLVENRHAVQIDALPFAVDPILYGVDTQLERLAYLFEFSLGKGKVLVSTLNFERQNMRHCEVCYTFGKLVNYCQSGSFQPRSQACAAQVKEAIKQA